MRLFSILAAGIPRPGWDQPPERIKIHVWASPSWLSPRILSSQPRDFWDPARRGTSDSSRRQGCSVPVSDPCFFLLQASHFLWACWGLIQDKYSTIDFNFLR